MDELNHDIENNASCSPSVPPKDQGKKKAGREASHAAAATAGTGFHEGVSVGPPEAAASGGGGAVGIPMAEAVQMEAGVARAESGGGATGRSPPRRIDDMALPQVGRGRGGGCFDVFFAWCGLVHGLDKLVCVCFLFCFLERLNTIKTKTTHSRQ